MDTQYIHTDIHIHVKQQRSKLQNGVSRARPRCGVVKLSVTDVAEKNSGVCL